MPSTTPTPYGTTVKDVPAALHSFMTRQGLGRQDLRADGRLTLAIDSRYRVHLHPAADQGILISAQVKDLAGHYQASGTEAALLRLMALATGLMTQYASGLSLDRQRQALVLQHRLRSDVDATGIENALGEFVNALAFWSRASAAEFHV